MVKVAQTRKKTGKFVPYKNTCVEFLKRHLSLRMIALGGLALVASAALGLQLVSKATALPGTRTISFYETHTRENLTITYKRYGQYIPSAMRKINYILRDWRTNQVVRMDPKLIDLLWEIHTGLGSRKPIHILSGYRSPKTNAMLRRRSRAVSRYSRHMFGMASDVRFPDISIERLRNFAMLKQRGGVGYYRGSFVHVDVGSVRHWPRMSKQQLAKLFPNGNSLHVPRGVARPAAGRVPPRPLPRSIVVSSAPAGVVLGSPPSRIKTPVRVQLASKKPAKPSKRRPLRLASNVPVPRLKPLPLIAPSAPVFDGPVPLPRANPVVQTRLAALSTPAPKKSEIVVASASFVSFQPPAAPRREVAIARPVNNPVEVITARPVQTKKPKRGLFGLASFAPRFDLGNNAPGERVASAIKSNRRPLTPGLMNVNRTLKGDRLVSHAALEGAAAPVQVANNAGNGAPVVTAALQSSPFKPDEPPKKPRPFGLLSALLPMFSRNN